MDLNHRPALYESAALPTELHRHYKYKKALSRYGDSNSRIGIPIRIALIAESGLYQLSYTGKLLYNYTNYFKIVNAAIAKKMN